MTLIELLTYWLEISNGIGDVTPRNKTLSLAVLSKFQLKLTYLSFSYTLFYKMVFLFDYNYAL